MMPEYDLSTEFCGLRMKNPVMNASGTLCFPDVLNEFIDCFGGVITKSIGPKEKSGNQTPVTSQPSDETYLNAIGLSNPGCEAAAEEFAKIYPSFKEAGVPFIVSVFGNSPEEVEYVVETVEPYCDGVEVNISCPNIKQGESTGVTIGKDPGLAADYIEAAREKTEKVVIAKMTPAIYIYELPLGVLVAETCLVAGADAISLINTIPGGMYIDIRARRPVLYAKRGGLSGRGIKPIGVGYTHALYEAFGPDIELLAMGGIEKPEDIVEYVEAGANAVAIGTALRKKDRQGIIDYSGYLEVGVERLLDELGAKSLTELRGVAHE